MFRDRKDFDDKEVMTPSSQILELIEDGSVWLLPKPPHHY